MTDSVFKANLAHFGGTQVLGRLTAGLRRWRDRNAALREFERLDDHDLRDIGVDRYGLRALIDASLAEREVREGCSDQI
ncbi:MAG TPA: DUF1127 domain-containing protein [Dongiaceae bacterium]|nr:DUF1127 domain-containing protein [Dongiaceae bacterium]